MPDAGNAAPSCYRHRWEASASAAPARATAPATATPVAAASSAAPRATATARATAAPVTAASSTAPRVAATAVPAAVATSDAPRDAINGATMAVATSAAPRATATARAIATPVAAASSAASRVAATAVPATVATSDAPRDAINGATVAVATNAAPRATATARATATPVAAASSTAPRATAAAQPTEYADAYDFAGLSQQPRRSSIGAKHPPDADKEDEYDFSSFPDEHASGGSAAAPARSSSAAATWDDVAIARKSSVREPSLGQVAAAAPGVEEPTKTAPRPPPRKAASSTTLTAAAPTTAAPTAPVTAAPTAPATAAPTAPATAAPAVAAPAASAVDAPAATAVAAPAATAVAAPAATAVTATAAAAAAVTATAAAAAAAAAEASTAGSARVPSGEVMALRARLEAAQHSIATSEARRRAAVEATATAQAELAEKHRVLRATRERLCDLAEGVSEALEATLASDPEVVREEEAMFMLRARLRCAQEAVAKHRARRDVMRAKLDLMQRVAALAPTTARRPSSASPAIGGSGHRATPASTRLNEDGLQAMMKRLVPTKHELARRPGLHPNSRRLFGDQGVEAPLDPPGAAPPANPDAPVKAHKVRREDLIQHLYEGPMQRLRELQRKHELEQQPSPSAVMSQERLAGMMKRLHDVPAASKRRALARERTDAQAAEAVGATTLLKGERVVGDRPRDAPQARAAVLHGGHAARSTMRDPLGMYGPTAPGSAHGGGILLPGVTLVGGARAEDMALGTAFVADDRYSTGSSHGIMVGSGSLETRAKPAPKPAPKPVSAQHYGDELSPPSSSIPPSPPSSSRPSSSPLPEGDQYELTVPEGYRACEDLPVVLPDGRSILVAIPDGLGPGDDFVALLPRAGRSEA